MLRSVLSFVTILILTTNRASCLQEDYYWREYTGSIPSDAVVAGKDINSNDIYIGQAYVTNQGLIVAQIYSGVKEVYAPVAGVKKVEDYIKILCGPQQNFYWEQANSTDLHLLLIDKHAVIGGFEYGRGQLNIGRISNEGEIKIGKVGTFNIENALFYFNDKGAERQIKSYEILLYNNNNNNVDLRFKKVSVN